MVSLGKLTAGYEDYYEREVAGGSEDYYAMRGEAAGEWAGSGAQGLGLEGSATGGELHELLEGRDPRSGGALRSRAVHVTGWDVTYSPPKSVSVLHAAGMSGCRVRRWGRIGPRSGLPLVIWSPRRVGRAAERVGYGD